MRNRPGDMSQLRPAWTQSTTRRYSQVVHARYLIVSEAPFSSPFILAVRVALAEHNFGKLHALRSN